MRYFCTYFDERYLVRGLALYQSLKQHCSPFNLWVLCMNRACYDALSQLDLPHLDLIALEEIEKNDAELLNTKKTRSLIEYYFTCTPCLPLFILNHYPEVDHITYLDADLFFFSDLTPIYDEIADKSVGIIEHRFAPEFSIMEMNGRYNVGFVFFRRDNHGLACLHWWRERCIEWCYDRYEIGRFADQKYLDEWPNLFPEVISLQHKGANLAPWNLGNYKIWRDDGGICIDGEPLIFFHFHALKQLNRWFYDPNLVFYQITPSRAVRKGIYEPYIQTLAAVAEQVSPVGRNAPLHKGLDRGLTSERPASPESASRHKPPFVNRYRKTFNWYWSLLFGLITNKYLFISHSSVDKAIKSKRR